MIKLGGLSLTKARVAASFGVRLSIRGWRNCADKGGGCRDSLGYGGGENHRGCRAFGDRFFFYTDYCYFAFGQ